MANPMNEEEALFEKIINEKLIVSPRTWDLIDHYLRKDIWVIAEIIGFYVTGENHEPISIEDGEKIIKHVEATRASLKKLRAATTLPEKITVSPVVWNLIDHNLRHDVWAIAMIAGSYVTGDNQEPIPPENREKIIRHLEAARVFLKRLKAVTMPLKPKENV